MDLRYLEEIAVFSRHLNYSQAAKELYISQPALSQHVAKVESELGFNLFSHDGANRPTLAGQVFCSEVGDFLASWRDLVARCARIAAQETQSIRVLDLRMVLHSLASVGTCLGSADITYVSCDAIHASSEFDAIDRGDVDVSFVFAPVPDASWFQDGAFGTRFDEYRFIPLIPEQCVLRVSKSNPLAGRASVSLDELESYTFVYDNLPLYCTCDEAIKTVLSKTGHPFRSITGIGHAKTSILSADSRYVSVFVETAVDLVGHVLEPQLTSVRFENFELMVYPFAVVKGGELAPAIDRFISAVTCRKNDG